MWVSINNTISQISNLVDVDVSPLSNWDALIYVSATWDWTATALPWGWDMLKATYDTDLDWVVDTAHDVSATPLITRSSVASQWGLLINIDSATGDVARTTDGWIEDEKYGIYADLATAWVSFEFDSAVTRTGRLTAKISTTDATWWWTLLIIPSWTVTLPNLSKSAIPIKVSTKYKLSVWVKTNNAATNSVGFACTEYTSAWASVAGTFTNWTSTKLSGTNDWTLITKTVTTSATWVYLYPIFQNQVAWNISDAWFDINSMTLEEVVEPVANSLTSSSPSLVSFTAVGSTDNIDQSQLTSTWQTVVGSSAWVNYWNSQSFTPTKSKHTWVIFNKKANVWTPTWDIVFNLRTDNAWDPSATILATYTMPLATYNALTTNADFTVNLPANLTAGTKYHYVIYDTATETWTNNFWLLVNSAWGYSGWDCRLSTNSGSTWAVNWTYDFYFKTLYYKPTTNFKASQNNSTMQISADEDGFLDGSVINLTTGAYSYSDTITTWDIKNNNYFEWNAWDFSSNRLNFSGAWKYLTLKINTWLHVNWDLYFENGWMNNVTCSYSFNNSSWTTLFTQVSSAWSGYIPMAWANIVYIRLYANAPSSWGSIVCTWTVDTSSLSTLRNYPTNKDVVTTYNKSLNTATTTATYRATAWGFPAIEYSATEYQFLDVDTTATGSTVAFSADWVSYTTVADGANIALSSTTTPLVWVKTNITANRLYLSSNDYNASGDKDGSNKMTVVYDVTSQGLTYTVDELLSEVNELKAAVYALQNP